MSAQHQALGWLLALWAVLPTGATANRAEPEKNCLDGLPAIQVQAQDGRHAEFQALLAGHLVAINFVFTRCQGICPLLGAQFVELDKALPADAPAIKLLSISLDPAHDSADRLQEWSQRLGRGERWTLLTGQVGDVRQLLRAFGMADGDPWSHAPVTWLIDARAVAPLQCERRAGLSGSAELADWLTTRLAQPPAP